MRSSFLEVEVHLLRSGLLPQVEDNFTAFMQEAILQSKLEFEQQHAAGHDLDPGDERMMHDGQTLSS